MIGMSRFNTRRAYHATASSPVTGCSEIQGPFSERPTTPSYSSQERHFGVINSRIQAAHSGVSKGTRAYESTGNTLENLLAAADSRAPVTVPVRVQLSSLGAFHQCLCGCTCWVRWGVKWNAFLEQKSSMVNDEWWCRLNGSRYYNSLNESGRSAQSTAQVSPWLSGGHHHDAQQLETNSFAYGSYFGGCVQRLRKQ